MHGSTVQHHIFCTVFPRTFENQLHEAGSRMPLNISTGPDRCELEITSSHYGNDRTVALNNDVSDCALMNGNNNTQNLKSPHVKISACKSHVTSKEITPKLMK